MLFIAILSSVFTVFVLSSLFWSKSVLSHFPLVFLHEFYSSLGPHNFFLISKGVILWKGLSKISQFLSVIPKAFSLAPSDFFPLENEAFKCIG